MNRIVWLIMMTLVIGVFPAAAADTAPEGFPQARAPEPRFEFSPVVEGTEVVHEFVVQNRGNAPLTIERVRTG